MKAIMTFFIFLFLYSLVYAEDKIPVRILMKSHEEVYILQSLGISIENLRENYVEASLTEDEITRLKKLRFEVLKRPPIKWTEEGYHDYYEVEAFLDSIHSIYPDVTRKDTIGYSVEGRTISAFLVTDYPDSQEWEPEVKFGTTIHGNEPVGTENCLKLISYLLDNYGVNDTITYLIDNTEIWFVPLLNPDGRQDIPPSRYNANGVDLNRNFPKPDGSQGDDSLQGIQPETQTMMDFCCEHNFVISTMFHTGACLVNFVWDYSPEHAPDSGVIYLISLGYASRNGRMTVIEGWYWYYAGGTLQDWVYDSTSCIDLTIELDSDKDPPADRLPQLWDDNRDAMLFLISATHTGITGRVTDYFTREPLYAEVQALEYGKSVFTDPQVGDYYKFLRSGYYTMQFSSPGYSTKTIEDVYVTIGFDTLGVYFDSLTVLNVLLWPKVPANISGKVTDAITEEPLYARVEVLNAGIEPVHTDSITGEYSIDIYQGIYTMRVSSDGYATCLRDSLVVIDSLKENFTLQPVGIEETSHFPLPTSHFLKAHPNPFSHKTVIEFRSLGVQELKNSQLSNSLAPQLKIYDLSGRLLRTFKLSFAEGNFSTLNSHLPKATLALSTVMWDGTDDFGTKLPSGVYIVKAQVTGHKSQVTSKIILIR